MKISVEWLSDFLPGKIDPQQAADALLGGGLPVESIQKAGDDTVLDVEVTSNRGDCLSHLGIAREIAALMGRPLKQPPIANPPQSSTSVSQVTSVRIEALDLCPHYVARVLRNVKVKPSPPWLVHRLEAVGLRPVNNIVDVTNYVMFEMGQPLHAFDFERLAEHRIVVRQAMPGEQITSIDGHKRSLAPPMLVIADAQKPAALAGVMGGLESEVSPATTSILLESARFDPLSVRKTARAHAMMSDSSYRFERQIDPTLPRRASLRAAELILQTAGGELLAGAAEAGAEGYSPRELTLRLARLKALVGAEIEAAMAVEALNRLGLEACLQGEQIRCRVPSWRLDITQEVDLIEEVVRVWGYQRIPQREEIAIRLQPADTKARTLDVMRQTLVAAGYFEAITLTFVTDALAGDFTPPEAATLASTQNVRWRADNQLRPSLLPGLLESVRRNQTVGLAQAQLFEIASTFWFDAGGRMDERQRLAIVGGPDLHELRGALEELLGRLDAQRPVTVRPAGRPGYAQGACGQILWGDQAVGWIGIVAPAVVEKLSLRQAPAAAELEVAELLRGVQHVPQLQPLPRYPAVERDVSLVLEESIRFAKVQALIESLKLPWLQSVRHVTTYRGKPLARGTKSVTVALSFRSPEATLTAQDVDPSMQRLVEAAGQQLGATLRT